MSDEPLWDKDGAMERVAEDMELFFEIFDIFLEEFPADLTSIETHLGKNDLEQVGNRAHATKSAVGNLGGMRCYEAARLLEMACRAGDSQAAAEAFRKLKSSGEEFVAFLNQERQSAQ